MEKKFTADLGWVLNMVFGNIVKKIAIQKKFPSYVKLSFCLYYHTYFVLLHKSEKPTERNERLSLWSLFVNWGTQFLMEFRTLLVSDPMCGSWIKIIKIKNIKKIQGKNMKNSEISIFW